MLKDIYFNLYHKHKNKDEIEEGYSEIEYSIDNVLDNNILHLIEEKDKLLQEKDRIIVMLEEKNEKFINETISKISYIVQEKDSLLEEKDKLIIEKEKELQILGRKMEKFATGGGKKL
ncbi:hypothetical protein KKG31_08620 [Patescibacteria group bacterium]|nr:hypothetical protein [Patescibacteria group bacterium]MBU1759117.1 hypothetical protein [Patescibacteria group bacterium]